MFCVVTGHALITTHLNRLIQLISGMCIRDCCTPLLSVGAKCVCVCVYWPSVREVCPNYEVVVFQPLTLTTPDLASVAYCYIAYLLNPPHPLFLPSDVHPGEAAHSCPAAPAIDVSPHGIIRPPGRHPSLSWHTEKPSPAFP